MEVELEPVLLTPESSISSTLPPKCEIAPRWAESPLLLEEWLWRTGFAGGAFRVWLPVAASVLLKAGQQLT